MSNQTNKALEETLEVLNNHKDINDSAELDRIGGHSLFLFYYSKYTGNETCYNNAVRILFEAIEKIDDYIENTSFSTGISRFLWTILHLEENNFIEIETNNLFSDTIDGYLHENMIQQLFLGNFDFHNGALGNGLYFFKRYQKSGFKDVKFKNYLTELLFFLERERINKIGNPLHSHEIKASKIIDSISQVTNFLFLLISTNKFQPIIFPLLESYTELIREKIKSDYYPPILLFSLWQLSNILNNSEVKGLAEEKFQKESYIIKGFSINCFFELSMIYNYLFEKTKNITYKQLKEKWLSKGIEALSNQNKNIHKEYIKGSISKSGLNLILLREKSFNNFEEIMLINS